MSEFYIFVYILYTKCIHLDHWSTHIFLSHGFVVECVQCCHKIVSVNKEYFSENEIMELLNENSNSVCSENSIEVLSENDSNLEIISDCKKTSYELLFILF